MRIDLVDPGLRGRPWETASWTRGPSLYLTWEELDCNDGSVYPMEWWETRAVPLSVEFEWIRATGGGLPIPIGSGYRTWTWNARSKGARKSKHPEGIALDIYPPRNVLLPGLVDIVVAVAHRPGSLIRGIGVYRTFVHFDIRGFDLAVRPVRVARWKGSRISAEVWRKVRDM